MGGRKIVILSSLLMIAYDASLDTDNSFIKCLNKIIPTLGNSDSNQSTVYFDQFLLQINNHIFYRVMENQTPKPTERKFQTVVSGKITRLYPSGDRLYFHTSADESPYGYTQSDYNFIENTNPSFQITYDLLKEAAKNRWVVTVKRSDSITKHIVIDEKWMHYHVDYVYVDF